MISAARFPAAPAPQQPRRNQHQHPVQGYHDSAENPRIDADHQQRSYPPSSAFNFDFRIESDGLGGVKHADHSAQRQDEPIDFGLAAFPDADRSYCDNPYEPTPLQIPAQSHPATHSPTTYLPSATSTLASHSFPDFPPPADSRSLSTSPLERTAWTDHSSSSLSLSPHDATQADLAFDSQLAHMPFPLNTLQSSSQLAPPPDPPRSDPPTHSPESASPNSPDAPPRIGPNGLAEDQPPTAQGRMRTRVYVACLQCRARKIRCDGGKPKCLKCTRRASECQYDSAPKRRGPDKKPGARQRTSKKTRPAKEPKEPEADDDDARGARKRRKSDGEPLLSWPPEGSRRRTSGALEVPARPARGVPLAFGGMPDLPEGERKAGAPPQMYDGFGGRAPLQDAFAFALSPRSQYAQDLQFFPQAHIQAVEDDEEEDQVLDRKRRWGEGEIGSEPSLEFSRKTWWDSLLAMYSPGADRTETALEVHGDLQFLFKSSNYFLSFFNVPLFFSTFLNPAERDRMQPALVLAGLALATFMRSSEITGGNAGRMRALFLRDRAQSALEASFNARWVEPTLAQAAWLLALFEMCAHPLHSTERSNSSMVMLDAIIRALGLTTLDAGDPAASVFAPRAVPAVPAPPRAKGCACGPLTLGQAAHGSAVHTPLWAATAAWGAEWSVPEIRREESRRLCWSTLQLAAGHTAHAAAFALPTLEFYCVQPSNYALLFPGEALLQFQPGHAGKETVWALYSRAMLLWNSCLRMRGDDVTDDERAMFAVGAWIESTAIEEALDAHTCGCDQAFMYQGREFLFITRMCISYEFRRFIPHPESDVSGLFNRKKAMAWLVRQSGVAKAIMHGLHTVTGHKDNVLAQRPFFVWWFMSLVARSLMLYSCDPTLLIAVEVCQSFLPPIEYLSCVWPCPAQRARYGRLHAQVTQVCHSAGVAPPPPPNFEIFAPGSPPMGVI